MSKSSILREHIDFKRLSVSSKKKIQEIERYIGRFLNSTKKPLDKFTDEDIVKFLNSLDYKTRTINEIKVYIKVFIKWYFPDWSSRFRNLDKICKTQRPEKAYKPEQMISLEEIKKIIDGEQELMYKIFWGVLFYGGFRPSEACKLEWNNFLFEDQGVIISVHLNKNKKDFFKSLPKDIEHLLKEWKKINNSNYVFPSPILENSHIKSGSTLIRLKKLSRKTINKDVTQYILRHSVATILYSNDDLKDDYIANQMGHSKSMKNTYLNLDQEKLKSKARLMWAKPKPMSKEERDEFEEMKKKVKEMEKQNKFMLDAIKKRNKEDKELDQEYAKEFDEMRKNNEYLMKIVNQLKKAGKLS